MELPEPKLSKTKRAQVLTHLFLYRNLDLANFSEKHDINLEAIKEYIQLLIQSLTIRGYYRKERFVIASVYKFPAVNPGRLTSIRKAILGLLAYSKKMSLKNISGIVNIKSDVLVEHLKYFINKGLVIGQIKNKDFIPNWIWKPPEKVTISSEDTFIVGVCMMLRNAELGNVAKHTGFSREQVFTKLSLLMLYRKLEARFEIRSKLAGTSSVFVNVKKYHISPRVLPLSSLQGTERDVAGYTILRKKVSIKELVKFVDKEPIEVMKILALLTARGTFQVVFTETNYVNPIVIPELKPKRTIEEMATLSFFNYEALFGLLSTQDRIPLKKLGALMNRSIGEVLEGVITLLLEGFISGVIKGGTLYIESIRRYSRAQEGTLDRWEKILLGMVIAKKQINVRDIALALGVDKFYAKERLYGFYGKGLIKGTIVGNRLEPDEIPIFPPLTQLEDLPIHYQEIFGFITANKKVSLSNIQKNWSKSINAARNIIYELTGSGLVNLEMRGNSLNVLSYQKFLPNRELEDLGENYVRIVNEIEKSRRRKIRLNVIANTLSIMEQDIFRVICQLLAHGYYSGFLTSVFFERKGTLTLPSLKMHCLNCGHIIKSAYEACNNCKEIPAKCSVCQVLIKRGDNILECPNCSNVAHNDHMEQWMKIKNECPMCKTKISKRNLKSYAV
jgi:predicted DNA-binding transcriptional regulator